MSVKKRWRRAWAPCSMTACSVRFLKVINQGLESARELVVRRVDQKFGCTSLRFTPQILSRCMQCATVVTGVTRVTRRMAPLTSKGTTRHAQASTGKCRGRWSSWVVLATTSLLTLLNFSFRLVSLDSHLLYFFFRENRRRENVPKLGTKRMTISCLSLVKIVVSLRQVVEFYRRSFYI